MQSSLRSPVSRRAMQLLVVLVAVSTVQGFVLPSTSTRFVTRPRHSSSDHGRKNGQATSTTRRIQARSCSSLKMSPSTLVDDLMNVVNNYNNNKLNILPDGVGNVGGVVAGQEQIQLVQDQITNFVATQPAAALVLSALTSFVVFSALLKPSQQTPSQPYPDKKYNADTARAYFDAHPVQALTRAITIVGLSTGFGLGILKDYLSDSLQSNSDKRSQQLSELLTKLGPSFIKVGQSLSIRTDLLSPAYVRGLKSLQDQVPAFDTAVALDILEEELGRKPSEVFSNLSPEPVAAASLGQVYKGTLRAPDGGEAKDVAIKVQRPDIMTQIALDMHLIRETGPILKGLFNLNTDIVGIVDTWGAGFVDELNYMEEANNAKYFTESIQTTPLKDVVFAPPVVDECSSERVLTTEWIDGERLDQSAKSDVTILCSIAMNTYLTMMLETGVLHCDPHPGNLLRTKDGRLCILDWGMVTRLDSDLQSTLIEHMAHLTSADYAEVPRDLLLLGFIPYDKEHLIEDSGVVKVLADVYGSWTKGGGAASVNVNQVVAQLQDLTAKKGNLFQIPPYFAYIAKSFSVLEGIGLSNDPKYSIVNECLPYVSKRLLTDKSERTGGALSTFIFGPEKNSEDRLIDYDRVEQLVSGYRGYTTSASGEQIGKVGASRTIAIQDYADQILDLLVSEDETPLQAIFLEQMAKIIGSTSRDLWQEIRRRSGTLPSGRTVLGTIVDPLGLWRTSPVVAVSELDNKTVETTRKLVSLMREQLAEQNSDNPTVDISSLSNQEVLELSSVLISKLWQRRSAIVKTNNRFLSQLLEMTAKRLELGERENLSPQDAAVDGDKPSNQRNENLAMPASSDDRKPAPSQRILRAQKILAEVKKENPAPLPANFDS